MNQEQPLEDEVIGTAIENGVETSDSYEVTTVIPRPDKDNEVKHYTFSQRHLQQFLVDYHQTAEIVVDIRPGDGDE